MGFVLLSLWTWQKLSDINISETFQGMKGNAKMTSRDFR